MIDTILERDLRTGKLCRIEPSPNRTLCINCQKCEIEKDGSIYCDENPLMDIYPEEKYECDSFEEINIFEEEEDEEV